MRRRNLPWLAAAFFVLVLGGLTWRLPADAQQATVTTPEVTASPILGFRFAGNERRFGPLEFIGGLQLDSDSKGFGGYSGIRLFDDRRRFLAISDGGTWLAGTIDRDAAGLPRSIVDASMGPLSTDGKGRLARKRDADAEAVELLGDRALIAYERRHRIAELQLADHLPIGEARTVIDDLGRLNLRSNRGIEALAMFPEGSANAGALLAISEETLDAQGNIRAFIISGNDIAEIAIARSDDFAVTDADFLPGGDLLVLERRFSFRTGQAMRLRRIPADELAPGNTATGSVWFTADNGYRIDNMEGLDVSTAEDGTVYVTLISDDNFSMLQRTLLLEFQLVGEPG